MGTSQRDKGKRHERAVAQFYRDLGYECRRGWQAAGGDVCDIEGLPFAVECKHHKRCPNVFDAMDQAVAGSKCPHCKNSKDNWEKVAEGEYRKVLCWACGGKHEKMPVVHVKVDRRGELVVLRLEDWAKLLGKIGGDGA